MVGRRSLSGHLTTLLVVMFTTLFAAATPAVADLYRLVYPTPPPPQPGSNYVDNIGEAYRQAMKTAKVSYGFDGRPPALVENTAATFSATVSIVPLVNIPPSSQIQVAYENEASLKSNCQPKCQFDIDPSTSVRKSFQGTNQITWQWTVTPRALGSHRLILEIQPILYVSGSSRNDFNKINQPISVAVKVHPHHAAYLAVVADAQQLQPKVPNHFTVGEKSKVTATLPLDGHGQLVQTDIRLSTDSGSVPATVEQVQRKSSTPTSVEREWEVTPDQSGPVNLAFDVEAQTQSGDQPLSETVRIRRSIQANDPPPSLWSRLQAPVLWATPFLALAATALTIWTMMRRRKRGHGDDATAYELGDEE